VDLVQGEVKALLQSALEVALSVVRANPAVLEGLGAYLEGNLTNYQVSNIIMVHISS
jgi:cell division protease FtsH